VGANRLGDRRGEMRYEIIGDLWATLIATQSMAVVDLGRGGMLVESPVPLAIGSTQRLRLNIGDETSDVTAVVRHTRTTPRVPAAHMVGLQFVDLTADARRQIDAFLDRSGFGTGAVS